MRSSRPVEYQRKYSTSNHRELTPPLWMTPGRGHEGQSARDTPGVPKVISRDERALNGNQLGLFILHVYI